MSKAKTTKAAKKRSAMGLYRQIGELLNPNPKRREEKRLKREAKGEQLMDFEELLRSLVHMALHPKANREFEPQEFIDPLLAAHNKAVKAALEDILEVAPKGLDSNWATMRLRKRIAELEKDL